MKPNATITIISIACGVTAVVVARDAVSEVVRSLAVPLQITVISLGGLATLGGLAWLYHTTRQWGYDRRIKNAETQKAEREANVWIDIAAPGSLVIRHSTNNYPVVSEPLHLAPGQVNGSPSAFRPDEVQRWHVDKLFNAQLRAGGKHLALPEPEQPETLQPIMPVLISAQRVLIAGASNAGKSNLAKHLLFERSRYSNIVVLDPHAPSQVLGFNAIGAGRNYEAIGNALYALVLLMHDRYHDVKTHRARYFEHDHVTVLIDEWTSIVKEVPNAPAMIETLLTESRKVNIHLVLLLHALTKDIAGVGPQIRASSTQVELIGGQHDADPRRCFILPSDGSRRRDDKTEYALPGVFDDSRIPREQLVLSLPDAKILEAQMMQADGQSLSAITKTYYNLTRRPSGQEVNTVKELLNRARFARENAAIGV